jgi:hypothetical protein
MAQHVDELGGLLCATGCDTTCIGSSGEGKHSAIVDHPWDFVSEEDAY